MANVKFKLMKDKKDAQGMCPVFIFVYYGGYKTPFKCYTKEKCSEKDWDDGIRSSKTAHNGRFKKTFSGAIDANNYLEKLEERLKAIMRSYVGQGTLPSKEQLKQELFPQLDTQKKELTWEDMFQSFFDHEVKVVGIADNTKRLYLSLRNQLRVFEEWSKQKFDVKNYTLKAHSKLMEFFIYECENEINTVGKRIQNLKTFLKYVRDYENVALHHDFNKIKTPRVTPPIIFLTWEEIESLRRVKLPPYLDRVRDIFLLECFCGLRWSDLYELEVDHIQDRTEYKIIKKTQKKTGKPVTVALSNYAQEIINKYIGSTGSDKALPVISNQSMNYYLKEIGQRAGLFDKVEKVEYKLGKVERVLVEKWTLLTTHKARHTFATHSILKGMKPEVLQKILGHSKISQTMAYVHLAEEFTEQSMLQVWNFGNEKAA